MLSAPEHTVHNTMSLGVSLYLNPVACNNKRKNNKLGEWNKEMATEKEDSARRSKKTQTQQFSSVCMYLPQQLLLKKSILFQSLNKSFTST